MKIENDEQYQDALTQLKLLEEAPPEDAEADRKRRELEAATEHYAEQMRGEGHRKGRPGLG